MFLTHTLTNDIIELNELIYAGAKLVCEKIVFLKNTNGNSKPEWEIWLDTQKRNLRQKANRIRQRKNVGNCWEKKEKVKQVKQILQNEEINQNVLAKEGRLKDIETG